MNFSLQVKNIKNEKKITNEALSERSGIPVSTLNKILSNDEANPKLDVVIAIARALECPLAYLIDGEGESISETMTDSERRLLRSYRTLDFHGKDIIDIIMKKECERMSARSSDPSENTVTEPVRSATVLQRHTDVERTRIIPLFDMPVSAGRGVFLDDDATEDLKIKVTRISSAADFALRISGNSMEPDFHEGDILLVRKQSEVERGELGIFVADGEGYFKRFMGDVLHSLNPAYKDMPISSFREFRCFGKVIGRTNA